MNKKVIIGALLGAVICISGCGADAGVSSARTGAQSAAEIPDSSAAAEAAGTETQTAAAPAERLFGGYVAVSSGSLKLRREPNDSADQLAAIPAGTQLDIYAGGVDGWYQVSYDGHIGYVSAKYIRKIDDDDTHTTVQTEAAMPEPLFAGFADGGEAGVALLHEPKAGAKTIGIIPNGTSVEFCDSGHDGWYFVHFNGRDGYVQAEFARKNEETKPPVSDADKKALEPITGMWFEADAMFARTLVISEDGSFQIDYRGGGSQYGTAAAETADGETWYILYDEEQALWGRFRKIAENGMEKLLPDSEETPSFERSLTDADE